MFVVIYEPSTDVVLYQRRLSPTEIMDERKFANILADMYEREIDDAAGYIPNCCGDIRVEFRRKRDDGVIIWSGQSFYFKVIDELARELDSHDDTCGDCGVGAGEHADDCPRL